jgi:hypothetical protein
VELAALEAETEVLRCQSRQLKEQGEECNVQADTLATANATSWTEATTSSLEAGISDENPTLINSQARGMDLAQVMNQTDSFIVLLQFDLRAFSILGIS